ncbi:MAG: hypothetical protein ACRDJP_08940, partial [Actinomycetota bacterium]
MSDAALVAAAEAGDDAGYEALHRRHVLAAWGLAQAVTRDDVTALTAVRKAIPAVFAAISRGSYPQTLPVRSAVLTATRAAAVSILHSSTWTGRHQRRDIVDRAFSGLPECWRTALWLVEVEGLAPIDAARPLGLPPDEAAGLAARARAGFKDRYVRIAAAGREAECQAALRLLPRAGDAAVAPHEVARLDQHLAACRLCRRSDIELASLAPTLRAIALPTPLLAMSTPCRSREVQRDNRRLVPALAAAVMVIFGLASLAAMEREPPRLPEQVASPIDAAEAVRDPVTIRTFALPRAVMAALAADQTGAPRPAMGASAERQIVAASNRGRPVPAALAPASDPAPTATPTAQPSAAVTGVEGEEAPPSAAPSGG